ncbi:Hypothetical predicted protein [Lecanosticta acicola]|uniref:Uncharacterized protein n=1 Tax=Lecanosticta acicola TaxID=111012 RepID=A0AAI8YTV8_9PEZI|nr:Hypothetical predicted protein [Lecanosticta acicola]
MKLSISFLFILCLVVLAFAAEQPSKQVIVSYPKDTPDHEYNLIKGFAAKTSESVMQSVQAMGAKSNVLIEEDKTVSINKS